jgi:hypothetical protein
VHVAGLIAEPTPHCPAGTHCLARFRATSGERDRNRGGPHDARQLLPTMRLFERRAQQLRHIAQFTPLAHFS